MILDNSNLRPANSLSGGHEPVMLAQAVQLLGIKPGRVYVDATAGAGGHLQRICQEAGATSKVIAIDQDSIALEKLQAAASKLPSQVSFIHANFSQLGAILSRLGVSIVDGGILADLGISSNQLDEAQRGFSFRCDGPLDMRMNTQSGLDAAQIVNHWDEKRLADMIYKFSDERHSRAIARAIVNKRPFHTTFALANAIQGAIKKRGHTKIHPATRTFQALRIAVNNELENLELFLEQAAAALAPGARLVIITFHSLEDRIVKQFFNRMAKPCICPPKYPICTCNKKKEFKIITPRPITASDEEILGNLRSRSAKLRAAEKIT